MLFSITFASSGHPIFHSQLKLATAAFLFIAFILNARENQAQLYSDLQQHQQQFGSENESDDVAAVAMSVATAGKHIETISSMVLKFLDHFKNPDSVNMPLPIPDPMRVPDRTYTLVTTNVKTKGVKVYGISKMRIENFSFDLVTMQLTFAVRMVRLEVVGNYSAYWLFTSYSGEFNVTISDCYLECVAKLEVTRDGELEAEDIKMEMRRHGQMELDLQKAGMLSTLVKTNLGQLIFEGFKPYMFRIINNNVRSTINEYLKKLKMTFPNSIPPIDLAVAESRKIVRSMGYDPYYLADYQYAASVYSLDVTRITLTGISSFYRLGNVKLTMENHTLHLIVHAGTELLEGSCVWLAGVAGVFTRSGIATFTVDYIHIQTHIQQSLDVTKKPKLSELKVKVGNVQLRVDGAASVDYILEFGVNLLPNILRYQIVQATEVPIKRKMQEILDNANVEEMIIKELPMLDQHLSGNVSNVIQEQFIDEEGLVIGMNQLDESADLGVQL